MYGIFTSIWLIFLVNVGKYTSLIDPIGITNPHFMHFSKETHLKINQITIYFSIKFDPPKNGACNNHWKKNWWICTTSSPGEMWQINNLAIYKTMDISSFFSQNFPRDELLNQFSPAMQLKPPDFCGHSIGIN